ncbi:WecB/TagA/CpsF family glycosyltransferase [Bacillus sp. HNG]|uniref:WecB/TagA/CpsF family glycosyltransferase n=1 Tax=Bacillus sp. HNG TaxID=2293325 RepID=UPI001CB9462A|nr:WecB/TagA/CpsF family glycosyltransferase [Bacillus sp. HNG]
MEFKENNMDNRHVDILGVHFTKTTEQQLVSELTDRITSQQKTFVVTANPEIVMYSLNDEEYKTILDKASYVIADGIGVVKAAAMLNDPLPERIAGFDLMVKILEVANEKKWKIFLLGSQEHVLEKTVEHINQHYPGCTIGGYHHGFFDWSNNEIADKIAEASPDIVLVALGVPKQEQWISQNIERFEKGLFMGIGGSFDVLAGTVKRAPEVWQKLNVEWLYRLIKQPWRWKRMMSIPVFVMKVIGQKTKG